MDQQMKRVIQEARRKFEAERTRRKPPTCINDVFDRCSPDLEHPNHLAPYVEQLERAVTEGNVHVCFHAPPQHGKSVTAKHALVYYGLVKPGLRHAYVTYNEKRSLDVRDEFVQLAEKAGLNPHSSGPKVTLDGGTVIQFVSRSGGLTGNPVDGILIVDDIIKDEEEGRSPVIKEMCWKWWDSVADTRCHPGSSRLVMNTRWAVDDLPGRLIDQRKYPYVRLAAECDALEDPCGREIGEALWPEGRPVEWLQPKKGNRRVWEAMWQGHPKVEGDSLFREPSYYDHLPEGPYRTLYGADLAYTTKTRGDWSVLLQGRLYQDGHLYLTDCLRLQAQADVFTARMAAKVKSSPGPVLWYGSTTEKGTAQMIRPVIPSFRFQLATSDKYVRAIPTADKMWNRSRVHLPAGAEWVERFCTNVNNFRGEDGGVDDEIDALAAIGDLAIQYSTTVDTEDLNRQLRGAVRGHLRAVC